MEKTFNNIHGEFRMLTPSIRPLEIEDYDIKVLESILELSGDFVKTLRKEKYERYSNLAFPNWKRASLKELKMPEYSPESAIEIKGPKIWKNINEISREDCKLIKTLDFEGANEKFVLLGDVFSTGGYFIKTLADTEYSEALSLTSKEGNHANNIWNNFFHISKNSKLTVIIDNVSAKTFSNGNNRFLVEEGAKLDVLYLNYSSEDRYAIQNNFYLVDDHAEVRIFDANLGGRVTAPHHLGKLKGKESNLTIKPIFFTAGKSVIDMEYILRIEGAGARGEIEGNGAAAENSRVIFRGTVDIKKGAKESTGEEHSNTTLLSRGAKAYSIPSLLVDENDVTASHAASIGTVDESKIFYLMSRGLSRSEALSLILEGNFEPVIEEIREIFGTTFSNRIGDVINERIAGLF